MAGFRSLGWGGGYTDEPISKILISLQHAGNIFLTGPNLKGLLMKGNQIFTLYSAHLMKLNRLFFM